MAASSLLTTPVRQRRPLARRLFDLRLRRRRGDPAGVSDGHASAVARSGVELSAPVIQAAIAQLPTDPMTRTRWAADPGGFAGDFDPCATLSAVIISIEGASVAGAHVSWSSAAPAPVSADQRRDERGAHPYEPYARRFPSVVDRW
ncbi:hypothetical protein OH799_01770 [Nocardia sp. NBC_00881]|uniref:hypothetical protein n=1 Tax=Nocardia sp. NBC_00881 TaxID=2975995 RepID=UPI003868FDF6|nr:hypothetical protein OH799_01770 [Nocardia sp. NBC_00881]